MRVCSVKERPGGALGEENGSTARRIQNLSPLMNMVLRHVNTPKQIEHSKLPFSMLATILERDEYLGRVLTGRIETGSITKGKVIKGLSPLGKTIEHFRATKILAFRGLKKIEVDKAVAGDIISICGMLKSSVSDTICDNNVVDPLSSQLVDPPTISVTVRINDSPLAGKEGILVLCFL